MPAVSSREPDEDRDVIVQGVQQIFAPSGEKAVMWRVWEGQTERENFGSRKSHAISAGLDLGKRLNRPVWLVDGPYPPKRLDTAESV